VLVVLQTVKVVQYASDWHGRTKGIETTILRMNMFPNHCCGSYGYLGDNAENTRRDWDQDGSRQKQQVLKAPSHNWDAARFLSRAPEKRILILAYLQPRAALL